MAYCCLILLGTFIQKLVFGELRVSEQQHVKDKFWNFIFYKFIFVFGIINVQFLDEVVLWCAWFSVLGFLNLLAQLGKDRFEYVSKSAPFSFIFLLVRIIDFLGFFYFSFLFPRPRRDGIIFDCSASSPPFLCCQDSCFWCAWPWGSLWVSTPSHSWPQR